MNQTHDTSSSGPMAPTAHDHLAAAQAGDEAAFAELTHPLRRELHLHCYRMLGSLEDADDALQETLLRAWRSLDQFEPRAPFRAWLYRVATNVCLTLLGRRGRQSEITTTDLATARQKDSDEMLLDPYPDQLIDEWAPAASEPETVVEQAESVTLAFVAAVQVLPPRQRATLLLREVLGFSAAEVAPMLESSVAGINSALQRARATLEQARAAGLVAREHSQTSAATEQTLVRRLTDAWYAADLPTMVSLLTEDVLITMPPEPMRIVGREACLSFFAAVPKIDRLDRFRLVPTHANRQPAVAIYARSGETGPFAAHDILVLAIEGNAISSITRFGNPQQLFPRFELPMTIDR